MTATSPLRGPEELAAQAVGQRPRNKHRHDHAQKVAAVSVGVMPSNQASA